MQKVGEAAIQFVRRVLSEIAKLVGLALMRTMESVRHLPGSNGGGRLRLCSPTLACARRFYT